MSDADTFIDACKNGRIDKINQMLEDDASLIDSRADDKIPAIIHATCADMIDVVDLLIARGADIEAKDTEYLATAVGFAAWFGREPEVTGALYAYVAEGL